jgi:CheY-like chemotaxis protein
MNTSRSRQISAHETPALSEQAVVVLVVDDSATNRIVLEKQLKKLGCEVLTANDGQSALRVIGQGAIDLVLLDCQMPDISGYEVAMQVRARAGVSDDMRYLPIIAISGDSTAAHTQLCYQSGMDGVLNKPVAAQELRNLLALWCGLQGNSGSLDEPLRIELHRLYLSTSQDDLAALEACVARLDWALLERLVHRMKGAALAIGAQPIVVSLEQLEVLALAGSATAGNELKAVLAVLRQQLRAFAMR